MTIQLSPRSPAAPAARPARDSRRLPLLALLVFLATLPLEWITLAGVQQGFVKPFHVAALGLIIVALARWRPRRLLAPVLTRYSVVYVGYAVVLGAAFFGGLTYADPYLSRAEVFRNCFYLLTSVVVAGVVVGLLARPPRAGLAWAGVTALATLLFALVTALAAQRLNPFAIIADALVQQDPDIISRQLLRSAFRTDAGLDDAAPNLRHKVFGGLLVAVFLGLACRSLVDRRRTVLRAMLTAGGVLGCMAVVLSLSRSITVCVVVTLALFPLRSVIMNRVRPLRAAVAALAVLVIGVLAVSPVGQLLFTRFGDTGSYEARLQAAGPSFLEQFIPAAVLGTTNTAVETAPHNLVLNSWLAGGVLAAIAAALMIVFLLRLWLGQAFRYLTGRPGWVLPVSQAWVLGVGIIPLVRSVTSGSLFHMVEWTAIGIFLGLLLANERAAKSLGATKPAPSSTAPLPEFAVPRQNLQLDPGPGGDRR